MYTLYENLFLMIGRVGLSLAHFVLCYTQQMFPLIKTNIVFSWNWYTTFALDTVDKKGELSALS